MYPTGGQFGDLIDSFRHKNAGVSMAEVEGLSDQLNGKYDLSQGVHLSKAVNGLDMRVTELDSEIEGLLKDLDWISEEGLCRLWLAAGRTEGGQVTGVTKGTVPGYTIYDDVYLDRDEMCAVLLARTGVRVDGDLYVPWYRELRAMLPTSIGQGSLFRFVGFEKLEVADVGDGAPLLAHIFDDCVKLRRVLGTLTAKEEYNPDGVEVFLNCAELMEVRIEFADTAAVVDLSSCPCLSADSAKYIAERHGSAPADGEIMVRVHESVYEQLYGGGNLAWVDARMTAVENDVVFYT